MMQNKIRIKIYYQEIVQEMNNTNEADKNIKEIIIEIIAMIKDTKIGTTINLDNTDNHEITDHHNKIKHIVSLDNIEIKDSPKAITKTIKRIIWVSKDKDQIEIDNTEEIVIIIISHIPEIINQTSHRNNLNKSMIIDFNDLLNTYCKFI
jgi:NAD+--asparagine ADP-ribosyltransferase